MIIDYVYSVISSATIYNLYMIELSFFNIIHFQHFINILRIVLIVSFLKFIEQGSKNKLGLNWAKLRSNWNWALLQLRLN